MLPTIRQALIRNHITVILVGFIMFSGWIVIHEYSSFLEGSELAADEFERDQRAIIKTEVQRATNYIRYRQSIAANELRRSTKERVEEAYSLAMGIIQNTSAELDANGISQRVGEILRPMRFNQGGGYYFAFDLNGIERLFPPDPSIEGTSMLEVRDQNGRLVVPEMLAIIAEHGEGFYEYSWPKPDRSGEFQKRSYIKLIEPLGWVVGTGEYLDDFEADIQTEIFAWLENVRFSDDGYLFGSRYDGMTIFGPAKGKNMLGVTDPNGVKIVQDLINAAQHGGGFVEYVMPAIDGNRGSRKVSYAEGIDEWGLYVGTGVYVDEIESTIKTRSQKMYRHIAEQVVFIIFAFIVITAIALVLSKSMTNKFSKEFNEFSSFFHNSTVTHARISQDEIVFQDFIPLVESANIMVDDRKRHEDERDALINKLEVTNSEMERFTYTVSHDLRSPLITISGFVGLLNKECNSGNLDGVRHASKRIESAAKHMHGLLNELLELSRVGRLDNPKEVVELNTLVDEVLELLHGPLQSKGAIVDVGSLGSARIDRKRVKELFQNLIENGIKYSGSANPPVISLGVEHNNGETVYYVQDNGLGIDKAYHVKIFGLFEKLSAQEESSGVGLALVKRIVEMHGGRIWVESEGNGTGSKFCFTFGKEATPKRT